MPKLKKSVKKRKVVKKRKNPSPQKHIIMLQPPSGSILYMPSFKGGEYRRVKEYETFDEKGKYLGISGVFDLIGISDEYDSDARRRTEISTSGMFKHRGMR